MVTGPAAADVAAVVVAAGGVKAASTVVSCTLVHI